MERDAAVELAQKCDMILFVTVYSVGGTAYRTTYACEERILVRRHATCGHFGCISPFPCFLDHVKPSLDFSVSTARWYTAIHEHRVYEVQRDVGSAHARNT